MEGVERVYHCAVTRSGSWDDFYRGTVIGTQNLLRASIRANVEKFVHVSSISVYRSRSFRKNVTVDESFPLEDEPQSRDPYARAKLLAERAAQDVLKGGELQICIVRPGLVYGPGWKWSRLDTAIPIGSRFLITIGGGTHRLPLIHVDDLVEAILLAGNLHGSSGQVFNIVGPESPTNNKFLQMYKSIVGDTRVKIRLPIILVFAGAFVLERTPVIRRLRFANLISVSQFRPIWRSIAYDSSRIGRELGWTPKVGLEEGLRSLRSSS
jgi:nucleoside-diphosphate-sugar epimerase